MNEHLIVLSLFCLMEIVELSPSLTATTSIIPVTSSLQLVMSTSKPCLEPPPKLPCIPLPPQDFYHEEVAFDSPASNFACPRPDQCLDKLKELESCKGITTSSLLILPTSTSSGLVDSSTYSTTPEQTAKNSLHASSTISPSSATVATENSVAFSHTPSIAVISSLLEWNTTANVHEPTSMVTPDLSPSALPNNTVTLLPRSTAATTTGDEGLQQWKIILIIGSVIMILAVAVFILYKCWKKKKHAGIITPEAHGGSGEPSNFLQNLAVKGIKYNSTDTTTTKMNGSMDFSGDHPVKSNNNGWQKHSLGSQTSFTPVEETEPEKQNEINKSINDLKSPLNASIIENKSYIHDEINGTQNPAAEDTKPKKKKVPTATLR